MSLYGNLATVPVTDLFQWIGSMKKTGALRLERNKLSSRVYFREGRIVGCSSDNPAQLLGQYLLYRGVITEDVLRRSMSLQAETRRSLPDLLLEFEVVNQQDMADHLAAKAEETLLGLFDWEDAAFWFDDDLEPDRNAVTLDLSVQGLLLRGMKRLDDKERIRSAFDTPGVVPRHAGKEPPASVFQDWPTRQVFLAANGERTVEEIALQVHGTEFLVSKCLYDLYDQGLVLFSEPPRPTKAPAASPPAVGPWPLVEPVAAPASDQAPPPAGDLGAISGTVPPPALAEIDASLEVAQHHISRGELDAALDMLNAAYRADPSNPHLRKLLAETEESFTEQLLREGLSPSKVPVPVRTRESLVEEEISAVEDYLLKISDGSWDVQSLLWISPMRKVDVLKGLKRLVDREILELRDVA